MKKLKLAGAIAGLIITTIGNTQAGPPKEAQTAETVIFRYEEFQARGTDTTTGDYHDFLRGYRVVSSSSSPGAPQFTNAVYHNGYIENFADLTDPAAASAKCLAANMVLVPTAEYHTMIFTRKQE